MLYYIYIIYCLQKKVRFLSYLCLTISLSLSISLSLFLCLSVSVCMFTRVNGIFDFIWFIAAPCLKIINCVMVSPC